MCSSPKREYIRQRKAIENKITGVQEELQRRSLKLDELFELEETEETIVEIYKLGEGWNTLHDMEYQLNKVLKELDSAYEKRNWTASDYASYNLVLKKEKTCLNY